MLSKVLQVGNKVELEKLNVREKFLEKDKIKTYFSKIYDIIEEDKLKIAMPIVGTKIVLLELNANYDAYFFTEKGLYRCRVKVTERYKEDNVYVAILEPFTGLQKYQRRQHFRLEYNMYFHYRVIPDNIANILLKTKNPDIIAAINEESPLKGVSLDLSGGGMRFASDSSNPEGSYLLIDFNIVVSGEEKHFSLMANTLATRKLQDKERMYEHRVQFIDLSRTEREDIIKFIFEEERRQRKSEKG